MSFDDFDTYRDEAVDGTLNGDPCTWPAFTDAQRLTLWRDAWGSTRKAWRVVQLLRSSCVDILRHLTTEARTAYMHEVSQHVLYFAYEDKLREWFQSVLLEITSHSGEYTFRMEPDTLRDLLTDERQHPHHRVAIDFVLAMAEPGGVVFPVRALFVSPVAWQLYKSGTVNKWLWQAKQK